MDTFNRAIQKLSEYCQSKNGVPRVFWGVYKPEIRRNAIYHDSLHQQEMNILLKAFLVKKSDVCKNSSQEPLTSTRSKNIDQLSQHERIDLSKHFHLEILSVFDFWNPTECNSVTNGLLKKLCHSYGTQLSLIETDDSSPLGLVFQHRAWLATHIAGTLSLTFVFPIKKITSEAMLHLVSFVAGHTQHSVGSDGILIIGEPEKTENWKGFLGQFMPVEFHSGIAYIQ